MYHRLCSYFLSIALASSLGCVGSPFASETSPPKPTPKKVTVDAEWSSDEPNEELLRRIKQQKDVSQRDESAGNKPRDLGAPQPRREYPVGDRSLDWQRYGPAAPDSSATQPQPMPPPKPDRAVSHAGYFEPADKAPPSTAVATSTRTPAAPRSGERSYAKTQFGTNRGDASPSKPSPPAARAVSPSQIAPSSVCVKGVVADGLGQSLAMLQLNGGDMVVAREGDSFDIASGEELTSVTVLQISDRTVSVQFGDQGKVMVLR